MSTINRTATARTITARTAAILAGAAVALGGALALPDVASAEGSHTYPAKTAIDGRKNIGDPAGGEGAVVDQFKEGDPVTITCQQEYLGQLWDKTDKDTFVPDKYIKTGTDGRVEGLPDCGAPLPPEDAPQEPVDDFDHNAYGFASDQCTAFAAWRVRQRTPAHDFNNDWHGQIWGDAGNWDDAARNAGLRVDETPEVGALAINDVHVSSEDGQLHGHVAYINKVYPDGSFDVEEYNWDNSRAYGTRHIDRIDGADLGFQHVVHFD